MAQMSELEPRVNRLEQAHKDLEDAMIVMAHLEKHAAQRVKEHAIWLADHEKSIAEQREFGRKLDDRIAQLVSAVGEMIRLGRSPIQ